MDNVLLVCDTREDGCPEIIEFLTARGFGLLVRDVEDYEGLDFATPRLYTSQRTIIGLGEIRRYGIIFGENPEG